MTQNSMVANRKHKDRLFRLLFNNPKELLNLYNALANRDYQNENELEITTLEDVTYLRMKNDISFILDDYLTLFEHQSTYNPNMPLRGLFYITDLYKNIVHTQSLFSSRLLKIPTPKYIIFYNGTKETEDYKELRLSDAFENCEEAGDIEVIAHMYNINAGHNEEIMSKCKKLQEYATFIEEIRLFQAQGLNPESAMKKAIDSCIEKDVLSDFLSKERRLIMGSILAEFDEKEYEKVIREDGYLEGREDGMEAGIVTGIRALIEMARECGLSDETLVVKLMDKFKISKDKAEEYIKQ